MFLHKFMCYSSVIQLVGKVYNLLGKENASVLLCSLFPSLELNIHVDIQPCIYDRGRLTPVFISHSTVYELTLGLGELNPSITQAWMETISHYITNVDVHSPWSRDLLFFSSLNLSPIFFSLPTRTRRRLVSPTDDKNQHKGNICFAWVLN